MSTPSGKRPIPYVYLGSAREQTVKFYEHYDANFLSNKVVTLLYIIDQEEAGVEHVEEFATSVGLGKLSPKYLESLRAEVVFSALHQCEAFFAMLLAPYQSEPHWIYLTTYRTTEIKAAIDKIVAGRIGEVTNNKISTIEDLVKVSVYCETVSSDPELANKWDENINNAAWLIERFGSFFQEYDQAYNSYKHGLRVVTGEHRLAIAPQSWDGTVKGPMHLIQSSEDALAYLEIEPVREMDGEKERPVKEVSKVFSPSEAYYYVFKMQQMLETIRATRLNLYEGDTEGTSINLFLHVDRDSVLQLAKRGTWSVGPARSDQGRAYQAYVDYMRAQAQEAAKQEEPTAAADSEDSEAPGDVNEDKAEDAGEATE